MEYYPKDNLDEILKDEDIAKLLPTELLIQTLENRGYILGYPFYQDLIKRGKELGYELDEKDVFAIALDIKNPPDPELNAYWNLLNECVDEYILKYDSGFKHVYVNVYERANGGKVRKLIERIYFGKDLKSAIETNNHIIANANGEIYQSEIKTSNKKLLMLTEDLEYVTTQELMKIEAEKETV